MLCPERFSLFRKYCGTLRQYNQDAAVLRESLYFTPRFEFDALMEVAKSSRDRRDEARRVLQLHILIHQCGWTAPHP
jgi:hypothetical protein